MHELYKIAHKLPFSSTWQNFVQILLHLKFHHVALCLLECIFSHPPPEKKRGDATRKRDGKESRRRRQCQTRQPLQQMPDSYIRLLRRRRRFEKRKEAETISPAVLLPLYLLFSSEIPRESGGGSPLGLTLFFVSAHKRPRFILSLPFFSVLLRRFSPEPSDEYSVPKFSGDNQRQKGGKDGRISRAENRIEERNFLHANFFDRV